MPAGRRVQIRGTAMACEAGIAASGNRLAMDTTRGFNLGTALPKTFSAHSHTLIASSKARLRAAA
jgi:hypothetical protein